MDDDDDDDDEDDDDDDPEWWTFQAGKETAHWSVPSNYRNSCLFLFLVLSTLFCVVFSTTRHEIELMADMIVISLLKPT